jgi:hypothetical protein
MLFNFYQWPSIYMTYNVLALWPRYKNGKQAKGVSPIRSCVRVFVNLIGPLHHGISNILAKVCYMVTRYHAQDLCPYLQGQGHTQRSKVGSYEILSDP